MDKLLAFQKKVGAITKDKVNPFYKSNYSDIDQYLEVIKPILNELDLTITQPLTVVETKNALETLIKDGETIIAKSLVLLPDLQDPQKMGSAITYLRRYSLQSLLALQAEDDDGNMAKTIYEPVETNKPNTANRW